MNLSQIQYLAGLNKYHSLRQASEQLYITPQALRQSLFALEKELDLPLIESSRTGTFLTPTGRILLEAGEEFLRVIAELKNQSHAVNSYKYLPKANFTITTVSGIANTLLAKILAYLHSEYPKIQIKMNTKATTLTILESINSDFPCNEFAFIAVYDNKNGMHPNLHHYPNLIFRPLVTSQYCCSVPKNHEIAHYKEVSLSNVLKYPLVVPYGSEDALIPLLSQYGTAKKIITITEHTVYMQFLQQDHTYLAFDRMLPSFESTLSIDSRRSIPLKENINISMGYIYHANHQFSALATEFLEAVTRFCSNHYGEV